MSSLSQDQWATDWRAIGAQGDGAELRQELLARWREPHRQYHAEQHLRECLSMFDCHRALAQHPDEIALALWFHDAIYEVRASDNEQRSADWASQALTQAGVAADKVSRIHSHIMATRHAVEPEAGDQALLVDIDLSILGASPARFAEYEQQIRAEYAWVPAEVYVVKRAEVLSAFLHRERLYATPALHEALDAQARANLRASLAQASR